MKDKLVRFNCKLDEKLSQRASKIMQDRRSALTERRHQ